MNSSSRGFFHQPPWNGTKHICFASAHNRHSAAPLRSNEKLAPDHIHVRLPHYSQKWHQIRRGLLNSKSHIMDKVMLWDDNKAYIPGLERHFRVYRLNNDEFRVTETMMADLASQVQDLITLPIPLLNLSANTSLTFSHRQIACLMSCAFFSLFPGRTHMHEKQEYRYFSTINFLELFKSNTDITAEKLKCIFNYFDRVIRTLDEKRLITYTKRSLNPSQIPQWGSSKKKLTEVICHGQGLIENEGNGMLQVDFANAYVGGGVLGKGSVQEEILFLKFPELIMAKLFTSRLADNECLIISGHEQFNDHEGYGDTFKYKPLNRKDYADIDMGNFHRQRQTVAMDALDYSHNRNLQYNPDKIKRELVKAYTGFYCDTSKSPIPVATGHWGCGAFQGDSQLKFIIQLMAATEANRSVHYFTLSEEASYKFQQFFAIVKERDLRVGDLFKLICAYHSQGQIGKEDIFTFVLRQNEKKPSFTGPFPKAQQVSSSSGPWVVPRQQSFEPVHHQHFAPQHLSNPPPVQRRATLPAINPTAVPGQNNPGDEKRELRAKYEALVREEERSIMAKYRDIEEAEKRNMRSTLRATYERDLQTMRENSKSNVVVEGMKKAFGYGDDIVKQKERELRYIYECNVKKKESIIEQNNKWMFEKEKQGMIQNFKTMLSHEEHALDVKEKEKAVKEREKEMKEKENELKKKEKEVIEKEQEIKDKQRAFEAEREAASKGPYSHLLMDLDLDQGQDQGQGHGQDQGHAQSLGQGQGHIQSLSQDHGFGQGQGHGHFQDPGQGHSQGPGPSQGQGQGHNQGTCGSVQGGHPTFP